MVLRVIHMISYWKEFECNNCGWTYTESQLLTKGIKCINTSKHTSQTDIKRSAFASVYSYSRLKLFEKCPKAYKLKYVLNNEESFTTIENHLGKCIHKTLEYAYKEKIGSSIPSASSIIDKFNKFWYEPNSKTIKIVKTNLNANFYKSEAIGMLNSFFNKSLSNDKSATVELEKEFEIELDQNTSFRGVIDRISLTKK